MNIDKFINNCKYETNDDEKKLLCYTSNRNCIIIMKKLEDTNK